ncbi:hypothetical protein EBZ37_14430, partial [bacterium]|nr:hypothetical protein [bacterium]
SRSAWLRDPSLDSMFAEAEIEKRPRDRNEIFKEHAQDHMEKNQEVIESMVSNVYHRKKQEVLALKGRQDFTKKELRNLNLSVYLQNGTKGQVYDLNHEEFKNKSLDEITQIISKKIPADQGPSYCFPYPATEAQLKAALEGSEDGGEDIPKPREPLSEPVPQREVRATCDIAQSFEDNATTLNQASKDALKKCIEDVNGTGSKGQGARCEHGIESIQASVRSCASMLRPKDRSKTNLQLSMERAKSMEQGFKNAALSLLGITPEVDGIDTESFGKYQNVVTSPGSDESEPTGTCGPQAPKNYGRENWLTDALSKNANSCVRSSSLPYEKCMEEFKDQPQQLWQCQPKDKAEAMALALKDIEERMKTSIG